MEISMTKLPEPGQLCCGFTAVSQGRIESLSASTAEFFHPLSGAQVLCIQNDDRELGFSLIYRTPQLDETDACHMAEHLVLSSCKKYRSRDVFFDMDSMSYSTFMNGLKKAGVTLNRKMLSEIAIQDAVAFTALCEKAKAPL